MATVNALSVALFNAAAGGYSADMTKNPAAYAAAVGAVLEKDLSSDSAFVEHLLANFGVSSTSAVYAEAKTALTGMVNGQGRVNAAVAAIDFLEGVSISSPYAPIATAFKAKVAAAASYSTANPKELDVTKLIAAVTGVDTDQAAIDAAVAAAVAAAVKTAQDKAAADAAAAKAAADAAAADAAAKAAADLKAAQDKAAADLAEANAKITLIDDTTYASEQAAFDAAKAAGDAALAAANEKAAADAAAAKTAADAALAAKTAELATANATITLINDTDYASEQAAFDAAKAAGDAALAAANEKAAADAAAAKTAADAALAAKTAELATANGTITLINDTTYASEQAAFDAGVSSRDTEVADLQAQIDALENPAGGSFVLTTGVDTFIGNTGNDSFSGSIANLGATDLLIDVSTADSDTLTLNGTQFGTEIDTSNGATIRNIENVVANFDSLTASTFKAGGLSSASSITINQTRTGSGATMTATNVFSGSTVKAGTGVNSLTVTTNAADRSVTVDGGSATTLVSSTVSGKGNVTVTGTKAATVTAVAATGTATVDAAAATTVNATGATTIVTAGTKDVTINLTGTGTTDTATVSIGADAALENKAADAVETLTINASAAAVVTYTGDAATTYNITGAGAVTLSGDEADFDGATITTGGTGATTLKLTTVDASDLSKAAVGTIDVAAAAAGGVTLLVNNNATVKLSANVNAAGLTIDADDDVTTTATSYLKGTLNLALSKDITAGSVTVNNSAASNDGFDTVNLTVATEQTSLELITGTAAVIATGSKGLVLDATSTAKSLDASAMTGDVTVVMDATNDIATVTTGSGNDTVTLSTTAVTVSTKDGNDTFKLGAALNAKAVISAGDGTDTLELTNAADISAATVSGIENITLATFALTINDSQSSGATLVLAGDNAAVTDDLLIIADIDSATANFSSLNGTLVDGVIYNATGGNYTAASTSSGLVGTVAAGQLDATALGSSVVMNVTGSDFDDIVVTGGGADVISTGKGNDEVASGSGNDTVDGGAGDDLLLGENGADTLTGGEGIDTIEGGAGNDTIVLTETTAQADTVVFATAAATNIDTITGFAAGSGADLAKLVAADTTNAAQASAGVADFAASTNTTLANGAAAFALTGGNTATDDIIEITATLSSFGNLGAADVTDGTELLKALSSTSTAATGLTATADGNNFYVIAYQNGNAYLYYADESGDADVGLTEADEITLVAVFTGITANAFASGDFTV